MNELTIYLNSLTKKFKKILFVYEQNNDSLKAYLDSLLVDLVGSMYNFRELCENDKFITIINILRYLLNNEVSHKVCKREVFKCIDLINLMIVK